MTERTHLSRPRRRGMAAVELLVGVCAMVAAGAVVREAAAIAASAASSEPHAPDGAGARPETHAPPPPAASRAAADVAQTFLDDEPRPIGAAYDDDRALRAHADPIASYTLEARLDAIEHEIAGTGVIEFRNATTRPVSEIYLHLYLNAFKNNRSTFLKSPFRRSRSDQSTTSWGYIDVRRLTAPALGPGNLWDRAEPADDAGDETSVRIPLPHTIEPGARVSFHVEWTSRLPGIVERTGHAGSFHFVGQWFPKLARLESNGTWAHFSFHPHAEFYADFGSYDVTLDVPADMIVGATGERVDSLEVAGRRRDHYRARDVHDFAWTAWDGFTERRVDLSGVSVRVLAPEGHDGNVERTLVAVRHGLDFYGELFGRYPYPSLTVVHPPQQAKGAGGMEYPTLITTGGPWYASAASSFVERVTLHELAHQWFYGLVATNEHRSPFLDEGLTSFAEGLAMNALLGAGSGVSVMGLEVSGDAYMRASAAAAAHRDVVARPAAAFASFRDVAALVYARTSSIFDTLAGVWGRRPVLQALGRYARRYRFDHPTPRHLVAAFREHVGDDAASVLSRALFEGGWVDFVAQEVRWAPVMGAAGLFDEPGGRQTREAEPAAEPDRYRSRVLIYRHGTLELPVDVDLVLRGGGRVRRRWDGRGRWTALEHVDQQPVVGAVVDPTGRVALDQNLLNNGIVERASSTARVLERITYVAELASGGLGP